MKAALQLTNFTGRVSPDGLGRVTNTKGTLRTIGIMAVAYLDLPMALFTRGTSLTIISKVADA